MNLVGFNCLDVIRRDTQQPIRQATQSTCGGDLVADLRYLYIARIATRLATAVQSRGGIRMKDCVRHSRGILLKKVQIYAPVLHVLMGCCYAYAARTSGLSGGRRLRLE
jgi:hypothetical protein